MTVTALEDLQESVRDSSAFKKLDDYLTIGRAFLSFAQHEQPTRIVSPTQPNYIFYQYGPEFAHKITRPLNIDLLIESGSQLENAFGRFMSLLADLHKYQAAAADRDSVLQHVESREVDRIIYTVQQAIGCISDSFEDTNQARKRAGQLFETLVKLIIQEVGIECEPRTINIAIPGYPGYNMSYELDLVFSRNKAILTSETRLIQPSEVVGSVKTTSKDRIDKIFLDKHCSPNYLAEIFLLLLFSFTTCSALAVAVASLVSTLPSRAITFWAIQWR